MAFRLTKTAAGKANALDFVLQHQRTTASVGTISALLHKQQQPTFAGRADPTCKSISITASSVAVGYRYMTSLANGSSEHHKQQLQQLRSHATYQSLMKDLGRLQRFHGLVNRMMSTSSESKKPEDAEQAKQQQQQQDENSGSGAEPVSSSEDGELPEKKPENPFPTPEALEAARQVPLDQLQEIVTALTEAAEDPNASDALKDRLAAFSQVFEESLASGKIKIKWDPAEVQRRIRILKNGTPEERQEVFGTTFEEGPDSEEPRLYFRRPIGFWIGVMIAIFGLMSLAVEVIAAAAKFKDNPMYMYTKKGRVTATILPPLAAMRPEIARIACKVLPPDVLLKIAAEDLTNQEVIMFCLYMISAYCQHKDLAQKVVDTPNSLETLLGFLRLLDNEPVMELSAQTLLSLLAIQPDMSRYVNTEAGYKYGSSIVQLLVDFEKPPIQTVSLDLLQHYMLLDEGFLSRFVANTPLNPKQRGDLLSSLAQAALVAAEGKHTHRAVSIMRQILEIEQHPVLVVQLAIELSKLGMRDDAIKYFRKALEHDKARLEPAYLLALALVTDPNPDVAASVPDETLQEAERILLAGLRELADMDVAILELHSRNEKVRKHNRLVREALRRGAQPSEELRFAPYILEPTATRGLPPHVVPAYELLILLLEQQGRLADALAHAKVYAVRCFYEPIAHYTYGRLLARAGRRAEALAELRESISLDPEVAEPYIESSLIEYSEGRFNEAVTLAEKATDLLKRRAQEKLEEMRKQVEQAEEERKKSMSWKDRIFTLPQYFKPKQQPELPAKEKQLLKDAMLTQAACYLKMKRFEIAAPLLKDALELDPTSPRAHCLNGQVQRYTKGPLAALPHFSKALEIYEQRFLTEKQLGEVHNAKEFFEDYPAYRLDVEMIDRFAKKYGGEFPEVRAIGAKVEQLLNM